MSTVRLALVSICSIGIGAVLGYTLRPAPTLSAHSAPSTPALSATRVTHGQSDLPPASADTNRAATTASADVPRTSTIQTRLASFRWQREIGAPVLLNLFSGEKISPALAQMLDLRPDEAARIEAVGRETLQTIERERAARAFSRLDDEKTLIVEIPSLDPAASRAIYDRFSAELASTLCTERLELVNEVAGQSIERLYDRFGLNAVRYELNLHSDTVLNGELYFDYKRHFADTDGTFTGWSGGKQTIKQIQKSDPVLARFMLAKIDDNSRKP